MKVLWLAAGHVALAVGFVGVFVPLLPTTPFLILASFCYARGSKRFEAWLVHHPRLGPLLTDWRERGAIPRRAKTLAAIMIVASGTVMALNPAIPMAAKAAALSVLAFALGFILTRPT